MINDVLNVILKANFGSNHISFLINGCSNGWKNEKTRQVKNGKNFEEYILRWKKNARFYDKIPFKLGKRQQSMYKVVWNQLGGLF